MNKDPLRFYSNKLLESSDNEDDCTDVKRFATPTDKAVSTLKVVYYYKKTITFESILPSCCYRFYLLCNSSSSENQYSYF